MIKPTILALMSAFLLFVSPSAQTQTIQVLHNFGGGTDGRYPNAGLTADGKGNFYGTTTGGGAFGDGTVFKLSPNGSGGWNETVIYNFCSAPNCTDGFDPYLSGVTLDNLGNLYGTVCGGGSVQDYGAVWELSIVGGTWKESVLYPFNGSGGNGCPIGGVIIHSGNLYGTTYNAGPSVVFELSQSNGSWTEQVIYSFSGDGGAGYNGLAIDSHGNIFGTTPLTVFELSPNSNGGWTPTVLHSFGTIPTSSPLPTGNPVLDSAGNLYGVTYQGGAYVTGSVYKLSPKKTGGWAFKTLYSFSGCPHKLGGPVAGIVMDASGNLYGTTPLGGKYCGSGNQGYGTAFELTPPVGTGSYTEKVLWSFSGADGANPYGTLLLDSAGNLYGTTHVGGSNGDGVVFEVTP